MRILFVQISDIHLKAPKDRVASRAKAVAAAVLAESPGAEACFLLLSGDIANTGSPTEYSIAKDFVNQITSKLIESGIPCDVVAIPGNHDLNLRGENDTRPFILDSLGKFLATDIDFSGSKFDSVISVQNDFFQFESEISGRQAVTNADKLYYRRIFERDGRTILFHCFNTAWLSRRNEQQAKLFLPQQLYNFTTPPNVDVSVALFHHPYNWIEANNYKLLKDFVESQADVVLTGHEHDADVVRHEAITGGSLDYLMAPAFDDPDIPLNGFQMLTVDFDREDQKATIFSWESSRFEVLHSRIWSLQRNLDRPADPLALRPEFLADLRDVGAAYRHPRCNAPQCSLRLRDLYVYPDLKHRELDKAVKPKKTEKPPILGNEFAEFLGSNAKVLLFGADDCGKTSFAKTLYEDLRSKGDYPLLISGASLKRVTDDKTLVPAISKAIVEQYATKLATPYLQVDKVRRILIVDDFDRSRFPREGQQKLIACIKTRFDRMLVIEPDYLEIQDLLATVENDPFVGFERCSIKEFGHYHRQKLIEKWIKFGRDDLEVIGESINKLVLRTDKTISTLIGKNTMPHHPVAILSLLQLLESTKAVSTANGAYGYLYEMLLKQALATVDAKQVDEKITYISGMGYAMFKKKQPALTEEEMRAQHNAYCDKYDMIRDFPKMIDDLLRAEVLVESNQVYRFKYPYEFYYSTAKYFQEHAPELKRELYTMSDHLFGERNANVLMFYVYLTKDDDLIHHIIENARLIFRSHKECDMEADVEFMNRLKSVAPPPLELEYGAASNRRDEYNKRQDQAREQDTTSEIEEDNISYTETLQDLTKILIAIKTLQVLGQILRNFTASLEGPLKLEITRECYSLGLRTISAILSLCQQDVQGLRKYIGRLIAERTGITDPEKLASRTEDVIVWMGTASAASMVKRVSYAVGHVDLTRTYGRVLEKDKRLSVKVIDTAIRLDHFANLPEKELEELSVRVRKNNFTYTVIRELVADCLYFFEHDFSTMQRLGAQWSIAVNAPKYIGGRSKK